jgi:DNA-binding MarR family transcriptional regulator
MVSSNEEGLAHEGRADQLAASIMAQFSSGFRDIMCATTERMYKLGYSKTHVGILWQLQAHGEMTMSRIADLLDVSLSSATGIIDRMEERGLVERIRVPDDRRIVLVGLTQRGLDTLDEIEFLKGDLIRRVLVRLNEEQLERLGQAITDVRSVLVAEVPSLTRVGEAPTMPSESLAGSHPTHN